MALTFPGEWRFRRPVGLEPIKPEAINLFYDLIAKIAAQGNAWNVFEMFKGHFATTVGSVHARSSSESWAITDLFNYMNQAADNPVLYFHALYSGFSVARDRMNLAIPDDALVNEICRANGIPVAITDGQLSLTLQATPPVPIPAPPPSLREESVQLLEQSINRAEQLLSENRGREAVQEILWVLESLVTGFRGTALPEGLVKGKYFNQIIRELKQNNPDSTLERAIEWCEQLHGYLSSPTGGSVRHGIDLASGVPLATEDARFFCNLIRSYVGYFQAEYHKTRSNT